MKELLLQFSAYSLWANGLLLDTILQLPEEKHTEEVPSSFNSLRKTLLHMLDAECIWWQRLKLQERITRPSDTFTGDMKELAAQLLKQNKQWKEWVSSAQERMLQHEFMYQNTKREQFKQPIHQMLLHLFNHATYHRGQLVTMLRELGVTKVPPTDFIVWSRTSPSKSLS
jgi:uncharacterized damage-inducible protein DinB